MQVITRIKMVIHFELSIPSRSAAIWLIRGVARLKVVAVPRQQGEYGDQINDFSRSLIGPAAQQRAAGLGKFLFMAAAHMEHKSEGYGQNQIEAPGDWPPVE